MFASQFRHDPEIRAQGTTLLLFVGLNLVTGFGANTGDPWQSLVPTWRPAQLIIAHSLFAHGP